MTGCYIKGPKVVALQSSGSKLRGIWDFGFQGGSRGFGPSASGVLRFVDLGFRAVGIAWRHSIVGACR